MKIKNLYPTLITLLISTLLISCDSDDNQLETIKASATLSNFGMDINSSGKISREQAETLKSIAKIPTIIPKLFIKNAITATGVNYENNKPIVLNSVTGSRIAPCFEAGKEYNLSKTPKSRCKTQAITTSKELEAALSITQPIEGTILKEGKEIPATYIVSVIALYRGSHCTTETIGGFKFEFCLDIPHK